MVRPDGGATAGGLVAVLAVAGIGLAVVKIGDATPPAPPEPPPSAVTKATFDPKKLVIAETRHWPIGDFSVEHEVRLLASDPAAARNEANNPGGSLVSGGGETAPAQLNDFKVGTGTLTATLRVEGVNQGEYAGTVTLNPLVEKAAAQEVTLKVRDGLEWPLIVLVLGMLAGVGGTWLYEARRRRDVLRIAVVDAASWLQFVPQPSGLYDLQTELVGQDPNTKLFPTSRECRFGKPSLEVQKLYCRIQHAYIPESLDTRTKEVQNLLARIDRWYRAGQAVGALRASDKKLDDDSELALVKRESEGLLEMLSEEPTGKDAELILAKVQAQAEVVSTLAKTWALYKAADSPKNLSPVPVYEAAGGAAERTPEQSSALVFRLRAHQAKLPEPPSFGTLDVREAFFGAPGWSLGTDQATPPKAGAEAVEPPWATDDGGYLLSQRIRRSLRVWDAFVFVAHAGFAALAYVLPIWVATQFGSWEQYLGVFAGGFIGKVALDQTRGAVRSTRLAPPSSGTAADPAKPKDYQDKDTP